MTFKRDEYVVDESQANSSLFRLKSGVASITKRVRSQDGELNNLDIYELTPGDWFGEMSFVEENALATGFFF